MTKLWFVFLCVPIMIQVLGPNGPRYTTMRSSGVKMSGCSGCLYSFIVGSLGVLLVVFVLGSIIGLFFHGVESIFSFFLSETRPGIYEKITKTMHKHCGCPKNIYSSFSLRNRGPYLLTPEAENVLACLIREGYVVAKPYKKADRITYPLTYKGKSVSDPNGASVWYDKSVFVVTGLLQKRQDISSVYYDYDQTKTDGTFPVTVGISTMRAGPFWDNCDALIDIWTRDGSAILEDDRKVTLSLTKGFIGWHVITK
jgi:hypothetical protein